MNKRFLLTCASALVMLVPALAVLAAPALPAAADSSYYFTFAQTISPWQTSNNSGYSALARVTGDSACTMLTDNAFAELKGIPDSATPPKPGADSPLPVATWMVAALRTDGGLEQVSVNFEAKNVVNAAGLVPLVYIGTRPPTNGGQFGFASGSSALTSKWQAYNYEQAVLVGVPGVTSNQVYVAIGFPGGPEDIGVDCISVKIQSIVR